MQLKELAAVMVTLTLGIIVACGGGGGAKATPTVPATATAAAPTATPNASVAGKQLFADKCSACHGDNAAGGYTMGGATSADLRWAKLGDTYKSDVSLVTNSILNGKDEEGKDLDATMPRWQGHLTSDQVSQVIGYLQTLTTDAPANQPLAAPAGASPGEVLFYQDCSVCHGADGAGDKNIGTSTSADLRWAKLSDTYHNDASLIARAILQNLDEDGKPLDSEMPKWDGTLTPDQVQQIIAFLQTLK